MNVHPTLHFSAVITCYNEAPLLQHCFASLDFCQEMIMVDMGSTDGSVALAQELGAKILTHELVPYPNLARQHGIAHAQNEWVISIDLDEVFPKRDLHKIKQVITDHDGLAGIRLPWQFYFRGKELNHTIYGRNEATKCVIVHRDRIQSTPFVHKEFLADGADIYTFQHGEIEPLHHYWVTSYTQFFDKMWRYIQNEGATKYNIKGQRFSWARLTKYTVAALKTNLFDYQGLRGGYIGVFLSFFHAWYVLMSWLSLRQYEQNLNVSGSSMTFENDSD